MHAKKQIHMCQPVYRRNDEGDCREAYGCGGPLADGQGQLGGSAEHVQRRSTHAVNGEARDDHRGEGLPHKRVHHCHRYPRCLPWVVPMGLEEQMEEQKMREVTAIAIRFSNTVDTQNNIITYS